MARTVTVLLREWRAGDSAAMGELMPLIYDELHAIAARYMRGERPGHTLRPTALVSEAYLRLSQGEHPEWNDRLHFFSIAARTMRQILVDHARARNADKRGGGERAITLEDDLVGVEKAEVVIAISDALEELTKVDERKARVVELHHFGGLTQEEIAQALEVHVNTVARDLKLAEAWLKRRLEGGG